MIAVARFAAFLAVAASMGPLPPVSVRSPISGIREIGGWAGEDRRGCASTAQENPPSSGPRMGINLSDPADWNTELPLVDVFRLSRPWISQRKGSKWGQGPPLKLDEHGWVKSLEPGCYAETPLCTIAGGHYPAGQYTVLYEGKGRLDFTNGKVVSSDPGRIVIEPNPKDGGFFLKIVETDPDDYVRNIRVIMPGFLESYRDNPWHPEFLKRWTGMAAMRFMDWMATNHHPPARWSDRPTPEHATFSGRGVALEWMIDLANRLRADPWFCIPHGADDDYVGNFARMVKERLDRKLRAYVEYSNEVWNSQFPQHGYAGGQGKKLGLAEKTWEAAWRYTAQRSLEIFKIWEEVFGGRSRLVRVLPSQSANSGVSRAVMEHREAYKHADVLAIAPYFGIVFTPGASAGTVEQILDRLEKESLPEAVKWMKDQKALAKSHGLRLVAYEAGQHLVGIRGAENDDKLTALLTAANAHPRMGKLYDRYLQSWADAGGELICHFSSVGRWTKWGSWGLLQYVDEDPRESPKFMSVLRWAKARGQGVNVPR